MTLCIWTGSRASLAGDTDQSPFGYKGHTETEHTFHNVATQLQGSPSLEPVTQCL